MGRKSVSRLIAALLATCISLLMTGDSRAECEVTATTTTEMIDGASERLKLVEKKLDKLQAMMTPKEREAFATAQRAWEKYADAHCRSVALAFEDGSYEPLEYLACKKQLTEDRLARIATDYSDYFPKHRTAADLQLSPSSRPPQRLPDRGPCRFGYSDPTDALTSPKSESHSSSRGSVSALLADTNGRGASCPPRNFFDERVWLVPRAGVEPATQGFSVPRSTD